MKIKSTRRLTVLLALWVTLLTTATTHGAEFGARAYGMGGAYTGVSDDLAAIIYNPAGLVNTSFEVSLGLGSNDPQSLTNFQSHLSDPESFDGAVLNAITLSGVSVGDYGVGIAADGSLSVDRDCADADLCANGEYMTQLILAMGKDAAGLPLDLADLKVGASLKRLNGRRMEYTQTITPGGGHTTSTDDWRGQGYSLTLGASFKATEMMTIGLSVRDVASSVTWDGTQTDATYDTSGDKIGETTDDLGSEKESLTPVYQAGIAVRPPLLGATLAADLGSDGSLRYGVEKSLFFNSVSARAGQIHLDGETTTTIGLGFHLGPVRLDAAVGSSDGFTTNDTMIEGSVRF